MKETDNVEVADTYQLQRIANALEEIIRMVKEDQKDQENIWRTGRMTKVHRAGSESVRILINHWRWLRIKARATSTKRQAASVKLQA